MENGAKGLKGLETWAKKVTEGYRDVNVKDMSTSFRDGLAFCAIIHHYKPQLIDFESLSRENIYQNNSLAFSTAEKQLGVPALLDAEDMVKFSRPDRLSVVTYLSQLHNCFVNENKVSRLKAGFKRILNNNSETGPPLKIALADTKLIPTARHEVCQSCKHRVFLLERLIIDSKLYHRTCFKCNKCNSLLKPGAYVESDIEGQYECAMCPHDEKDTSSTAESQMDSPEVVGGDITGKNDSPPTSAKPSSIASPLFSAAVSPLSSATVSPLSSTVSSARNSFLQKHLVSVRVNDIEKQDDGPATETAIRRGSDSDDSSSTISSVSVKDKISVFESSQVSSPTYSPTVQIATSVLGKDTITNCDQKLLSTSTDGKSKSSADTVPILASQTDQNTEKLPFDEEVGTSAHTVPSSESISPEVKDNAKNSETTELSSSKITYPSLKQQRYQSQLTKDIFQPNLKPLKLSIPSIRTTDNKDSASLPISPLVKPTVFNIPHIRSSYLKKASSSGSNRTENLDETETSPAVNESKSENDLNIAQNKRDIAVRRRSSLESDLKNTRPSSANLDTPVHPTRRSSKSLDHSNSFNDFYRSPLQTGRKVPVKYTDLEKNNSVNFPLLGKASEATTKEVCEAALSDPGNESIGEGHGLGSSVVRSTVDNTDNQTSSKISNIESEIVVTPVPRTRRSLERKSKVVCDTNLEEDALKENKETHKTTLSEDITPEKETRGETTATDLVKDSSVTSSSTVEAPVVSKPVIKSQETPEIVYPDDLNPFGDDDDDQTKNVVDYPDDLNPFGADEPTPTHDSASGYDESKNPFASDDDDDTDYKLPSPAIRKTNPKPDLFSTNGIDKQISPHSNCSSPSGSLTGTWKKRKAPAPPKMSDIFSTAASDTRSNNSLTLCVSPSPSKRSLGTPSPKLRKSKPAPPPPPMTPPRVSAATKEKKEMDNMKLKSSVGTRKDSVEDSVTPLVQQKKKRPAPPVPIPPRREVKKLPLKEIQQEMKEIEEKQEELEKQGRDLEVLIRDRDKDQEPTIEEEESIMQLFELVNQKNALFRRQAELMYIKRSQRLEEEQVELEFQIRCLLTKPKSQQTNEDDVKVTNLTQRLLDVVDQRNEIIESIEMDRKRELEEDVSVQEHIEIKNGDLPITAEIKEKSKHKKKHKKDKKKKESEDAEGTETSGKNTLKRKKWFSSKSTQ